MVRNKRQVRLTIGELCSAIESGALPAGQDRGCYAVSWRDLHSLIVRRALGWIGPAEVAVRVR